MLLVRLALERFSSVEIYTNVTDSMGWIHGQNERQEEIIEKIGGNETRRLRKTRKTTAKMGGLGEERSKKGRGGRPRLRWEDCVKSDLRKAEEEDHG